MGRTGPYLAAGRPGPGSRGPSGAGSPSGRRGRRLWAERAQARKWLSKQVLSCSLRPLAHHARGAGSTPSVGAGSPRITGFAPLVTKENPGRGSQDAQPDLGPGLWALLPPPPDPLPRSPVQGGPPSLPFALTVFKLVHTLPQRPEVGVPQCRLC